MNPLATRILQLNDAGEYPAAIAAACECSPGHVYTVLRKERPKRTRKPRAQTSEVRPQVLGLYAAGVKRGRIAQLLRVSRAYVYRVVAESPPTTETGET